MDEKRTIAICLIVVLLLAAYVGSYLATVEGKIGEDRHGDLALVATYTFGDPVAEWLFWPANQIDRTVRPGKWEINWRGP